jgi:hydrogenase 3 maturation protease
VGVGNEQRRDDAAGVMIARRLASLSTGSFLILEAGHAPENATGSLRRFAPDSVLLVDAAEMGEPPGTVRWVEMEDISGMSASTHTLPLSMLAEYLRLELGCEVLLLGLQPASMDYGEGLGEAMAGAVEEIVDVIARG